MVKMIADEALARIIAAISLTNNGKLMIERIANPADRARVPGLIADGHLIYARFIQACDSVRLPGSLSK